MLGGGTFTLQNKTLNGAYINFVSLSSASTELSERGVATMPLSLNWGPDGMFEINQEDFISNPMPLLGYPYTDDNLKTLRDLFLHCKKLYAYRLNGSGMKAKSIYATAKYAGTRGNDIKNVIEKNVDGSFDVITYLGNSRVDTQTVAAATDLKANDYVSFDTTATLAATAGTPLTGGTNTEITGDTYQKYLDAAEGYSFNTMGVDATDDTTLKLFQAYEKRMRENVGKKFQLVAYHLAADYEGTINVNNTVKDDGAKESSLVYWVTGAAAGCAVNASLLNSLYDGEYTVDVDYSQSELEQAIKAGKFTFHNVNGNVRVLEDCTSLTTTTAEKNDLFKDNKVIRIIDQIANDVATIFAEKYLGQIVNDADGRVSLWNDLVDFHNKLAKLRAITNFDSKDITVAQGETKNAVAVTESIEVTGTMGKLYMVVTVE